MRAYPRAWLMAPLFIVSFSLSCRNAPGLKDVVLDPAYYGDLYDYGPGDSFLGRGINMGNYLEAEKSADYPLGEGSWSDGQKIKAQDFAAIKAAGFSSVRIPVRWSDHASREGPDYAIDPAFMSRVREVLAWARAQDLIVILNCHHYSEISSSTDPLPLAWHTTRLKAIWTQICSAFPITEYPRDVLVFELLNEPSDRLKAGTVKDHPLHFSRIILYTF